MNKTGRYRVRVMAATTGVFAAAAIGAAPTAAQESDRDTRIVGGSPTTIAQVPWQVALARNDFYPGDGFDRQFCGGTLVAPTIVITAAHCVFDNPIPVIGFNPASQFEVFTGRTTLSSSEGQAIDVSQVYYFEGTPSSPTLQRQSSDPSPGTGQLYDENTTEWDAVFLQLAQPSTTGSPIKLAGAGEEATWAAGQSALISGWGDLAEGAGDYPDQLQAATVPIVLDATCVNNYAAVGIPIFPEVMVCAGLPEGGGDTCQGDSGGPLAVRVEEATGGFGFRLVGDTSFGVGCARPALFGVYGRLGSDPMRSAFVAGIQTVAGVNVAGAGARPIAAPETTITRHPKNKVRTRKKRVRAKFEIATNEPATLQCAIDGGPFRPCGTSFSKRVKKGRHEFAVFATDLAGQADPTPATFGWRVKRRR